MKLPDSILAKTLGRFGSLIAEGQGMLTNASDVPPEMKEDWINGDVRQVGRIQADQLPCGLSEMNQTDRHCKVPWPKRLSSKLRVPGGG